MPSVFVDGSVVPAGHDSFYYARWILDSVRNGGAVSLFDARSQYPEGTWITSPWGSTWVLSMLVLAALKLGLTGDPLAAMVFLPPLWLLLNSFLLLAICRALRFSLPGSFLALMCLALSPLTLLLHGIGMVDPHYVEFSFVLLTLLAGLRWFGAGGTWRDAALLGVVLGAAPAFHNSLFILQIPVVGALAWSWWRGESPSARELGAFCMALGVTTLLLLLPSEPFWRGHFRFHTHSWFHLYVAVGTAAVALYMHRFPASGRSLGALVPIGIVMVVPLVPQLALGTAFMSSEIARYDVLAETQSLYALVARGGAGDLTGGYSGLIWASPLIAVGLGVALGRTRDRQTAFFAVSGLWGLLLMWQMQRFHYFGSFALYIPLLLVADHLSKRFDHHKALVWSATILLIAAAYFPVRQSLLAPIPPGMHWDYALARPIYGTMEWACAENPGVVLADHNDGHHIFFHTKCGVIANNMILTPESQRKVEESDRLLALGVDHLDKLPPYVRYIYVRRNDNVLEPKPREQVISENAGLRADLLFRTGELPPTVVLLSELRVRLDGTREEPLAGLFELRR